MIGETVSHYRITALLGAGGMGVVYRAEDLRLQRQVALKFLPFELTQDHDARQRLVQEARAGSALDHPNICTVHEIDETPDGRVFVAMAYYEGETLKQRIARGPLPVAEAVDVATQLARAVAAAHEAGILHCDLKPANVVVTTRGQVKLLDFGVAKLLGQTGLTRTGETLGTVAYMAPEQLTGAEADARTDVWALGVVLPEIDEINYAPRVKTPLLMLNGRDDHTFPVNSSQLPMFRLLGTPEADKRHVLYDGGHVFPFARIMKDTLDWLDRYLGAPRPASADGT